MERSRTVLRVIAVLIGLRGLMNLGKPFGTGSGMVFLGTLYKGTAMAVLGALVGATMLGIHPLAYVPYSLVALGFPLVAVWLLARHRDELR
jgi:hypothetical protein